MPPGPLLSAARRSGALARAVPAIGLVLFLCAAGLPGSAATFSPASLLARDLAGPCIGPSAPSAASGGVLLVGTSTPLPTLVGVTIRVAYSYTQVTVIGNHQSSICVSATASGATSAGGAWSVALPLPSNQCNPHLCIVYSGPNGPLSSSTSGPPPGFFERDPTTGTSPATITWDAYLGRAQLNLSGVDVVSLNAPVSISALAWDAAGARAHVPLTYVWSLAGLGWGNLSQSGPNITIEGIDSGWVGSLFVVVHATFGATTETAQSVALSLDPVPTRMLTGTASATPVDPGVPVTFYLTGLGAPGYLYTATVNPGVGTGPVSAGCTSTQLANGSVGLGCQVQAEYLQFGTDYPTASISNGYSVGGLALAPVLVHSAEQVWVGAPALTTYPNRTVQFTVNVTAGSGTGPFGPACISAAAQPGASCQFQNATTWAFDESFPAPGTFTVRASVRDHFGENQSAAVTVLVVPALSAKTNGSATISVFTNETAPLSIVIGGGALPVSAWWNLSGALGNVCFDVVAVDGTVTCPAPTGFPGVVNLTVTVRDALGSTTVVVFHITVTALPAGKSGPTGVGVGDLSLWLVAGFTGAILAGVLLATVGLRRLRARAERARGGPVEEAELERMAQGREHLLAQADPARSKRPDELVADWTGPPIAPEEWAEWISALVADGSLVPSRGPDWGLVYRRAPPPPSTPRIQFDPTVWEAKRAPFDDDEDPPEGSGNR